jgi:peptide/nickel transport system substrate-binding protein
MPPYVMRPMTRQSFLRASLALPLVGAGLAAGCGSSASSTSINAGPPRRGGNLRLGLTGGSSSDSLAPLTQVTNVDFALTAQMYEGLVTRDAKDAPVLVLAESMEQNSAGTEWTVRLRPNVVFHDGKPLTADDVRYTFATILDPKSPTPGATSLTPLDLAGIKILDQRTLRIPCKHPFTTFVEVLAGSNYFNIIPVGFDIHRPVGTGPYRVTSFTPGQRASLRRFPDYWQHGLPYADELTIIDFADEASQVSALQSGQVDAVNSLSVGSVAALSSSGMKIIVSESGGFTPFTMRVDAAPFDDVRVRQAMRLVVDRKGMRDQVFGGKGILGNDVFSPFDPAYDHSLPQREQDTAEARRLLRAAGKQNLSVELVTCDLAQGATQAAEVFVQNAGEAGVRVNLRKLTVTDFYGSGFLNWDFAQDFWDAPAYLPLAAEATITGAPFNETHFNDPHYNALYQQALSEPTDAGRQEIVQQMMKIDYETGGMIIPYFSPIVDAVAPHVNGVIPTTYGLPLNGLDFKSIWLS